MNNVRHWHNGKVKSLKARFTWESDKQTIGYWLDDSGNDADGTPRPFRWL